MSCSNYCSFFSIFLTFLLILKTIYDFIADEFWKLLNTVHIIVFMFLCICIRVFVHVYSATHLKAPHFSAILSYPLFYMLSYRYYLILVLSNHVTSLFRKNKCKKIIMILTRPFTYTNQKSFKRGLCNIHTCTCILVMLICKSNFMRLDYFFYKIYLLY